MIAPNSSLHLLKSVLNASKSVVFPWSTCPIIVMIGALLLYWCLSSVISSISRSNSRHTSSMASSDRIWNSSVQMSFEISWACFSTSRGSRFSIFASWKEFMFLGIFRTDVVIVICASSVSDELALRRSKSSSSSSTTCWGCSVYAPAKNLIGTIDFVVKNWQVWTVVITLLDF